MKTAVKITVAALLSLRPGRVNGKATVTKVKQDIEK